jgi:hypothetical protein
MTASAHTIAAGNDATATISEVDGQYNVDFGIPSGLQGEQGIQGERGPQGGGFKKFDLLYSNENSSVSNNKTLATFEAGTYDAVGVVCRGYVNNGNFSSMEIIMLGMSTKMLVTQSERLWSRTVYTSGTQVSCSSGVDSVLMYQGNIGGSISQPVDACCPPYRVWGIKF